MSTFSLQMLRTLFLATILAGALAGAAIAMRFMKMRTLSSLRCESIGQSPRQRGTDWPQAECQTKSTLVHHPG